MAGKSRIDRMNVNCLRKATNRDQQDTQQDHDACGSSSPSRRVG
jgi:hypothetical protein